MNNNEKHFIFACGCYYSCFGRNVICIENVSNHREEEIERKRKSKTNNTKDL